MSRFGRASAMGAGPPYLSRVTAADFGPAGGGGVARWWTGSSLLCASRRRLQAWPGGASGIDVV